MSNFEDLLKQTENVIGGAGRVRRAYLTAREGGIKPSPVPVQSPMINLDSTMKMYLAAGAVALVAWFWLMRRR